MPAAPMVAATIAVTISEQQHSDEDHGVAPRDRARTASRPAATALMAGTRRRAPRRCSEGSVSAPSAG